MESALLPFASMRRRRKQLGGACEMALCASALSTQNRNSHKTQRCFVARSCSTGAGACQMRHLSMKHLLAQVLPCNRSFGGLSSIVSMQLMRAGVGDRSRGLLSSVSRTSRQYIHASDMRLVHLRYFRGIMRNSDAIRARESWKDATNRELRSGSSLPAPNGQR